MNKHRIGPLESEDPEQRKLRAEFQAWMVDNYPALDLQASAASGYYTDPVVNCCWEIWLHLSGKRS